MSRLIESIRLEDGVFHNLKYHQARIDRALVEVQNSEKGIQLYESLLQISYPKLGVYKCRVVYNTEIISIEFVLYKKKEIESLKVVSHNEIEYSHKFENRLIINQLFEQRQSFDDILIIKNGMVTDSSYSNVIFFDGNKWVTPKSPLLKGTMRQMLVDEAKIEEQEIRLNDILLFKSCRLINAMLGFDGPEIEVSRIVF